jgi:hypothetical protein
MVAARRILETNGERSTFETMKPASDRTTPDELTGQTAIDAAAAAWSGSVADRQSKGLPSFAIRDGILVRVDPDGTVAPVTDEDLDEARAALSRHQSNSSVANQQKKIA